MINAIIIEDERTAIDNLIDHIQNSGELITVLATLETVEESVQWLTDHPSPDLIFMDIHLRDGISFSIFEKVKVSAPIIFVTAFDNFMVQAFEQTGIEYLLKPIHEHDLKKAIAKYKDLKDHFLKQRKDAASPDKTVKSRIVVRKGLEFISILLDDVACFFTEQKISFLVTKENRKYMVNENLKELEEILHPKQFYRANRKYIVNINYIRSYRPSDKIKIAVDLTVTVPDEIIVSQENAIGFRKWMSSL